jgi:hypothetical protein
MPLTPLSGPAPLTDLTAQQRDKSARQAARRWQGAAMAFRLEGRTEGHDPSLDRGPVVSHTSRSDESRCKAVASLGGSARLDQETRVNECSHCPAQSR